MPDVSTLLVYLGTMTLVAVSPGPAVLYVMALASRGGVRGSLAGIAGLQVGALLFFAGAGTGLAAVLMTLTAFYAAVKVAGALYLCWLGIGLIRATLCRSPSAAARSSSVSEAAPVRVFWEGLFVQLTNPKAFLFATALLPQFLDTRAAVLPQLALLFALAFVVDTASMLTYASLAARGVSELRASAAAAWLQRVFGAALIGFGLHLALAQR